MLTRLTLHIVEEPVLWSKTEKVCASQYVFHAGYRQEGVSVLRGHAQDKGGCVSEKHGMYHSSVSQAQGSSCFMINDGNVPTNPYAIPANTHTFNWYGNVEKCLRPPMAHVATMNRFKESPTTPIPLEKPHISVYSSSVYACTGQGWMQLSR
jgi:hypothetical protein